jgi:hypothetical protein
MPEDPVHTNRVDAPAQNTDLPDPERVRGVGPASTRLADVLRSLSSLPSRREVLRGLAVTGLGLGLGLGLAVVPTQTEAKPARRKKRKRPQPAKPNRFGCLEVNDPCRRHLQCCSGICTGKPGRKRCRAHGTGTCNQANPAICETAAPEQTFCNNSRTCVCIRTTADSSFCGQTGAGSGCTTCKRDTDCVKLGFPSGSACAPVATGACAGECPTAMFCMAPCGYVPPAPAP